MRYIPVVLSHVCVWLGYCQLGEASVNMLPHKYSQFHDTNRQIQRLYHSGSKCYSTWDQSMWGGT